MRVLYSGALAAVARPAAQTLDAGAAATPIALASAVTGFALFDTNCADVTIEGSDDDFATTPTQIAAGAVTGQKLVTTSSVTRAKWRAKAVASGTIGLLYPGALATLINPTFPFAFETTTAADDRTTRGGVGYSKLLYARREGEWAFDAVPDAQLAAWQAWYSTTQGFRLPFVIEDPLTTGLVYLVRAPGPFPLRLTRLGWREGRLSLAEVI